MSLEAGTSLAWTVDISAASSQGRDSSRPNPGTCANAYDADIQVSSPDVQSQLTVQGVSGNHVTVQEVITGPDAHDTDQPSPFTISLAVAEEAAEASLVG
jgi:hypothetical protein